MPREEPGRMREDLEKLFPEKYKPAYDSELAALGIGPEETHPVTSPAEQKVKNDALLRAAKDGRIEDVKTLLSQGADPNSLSKTGFSALHMAVNALSYKVLKLLLKAGADMEVVDPNGKTPLMAALDGRPYASQSLRKKVALTLIHHGANIHRVDLEGGVPLHKAAWLGRSHESEEMLKRGVAVNARNSRGRTPLHNAVLGLSNERNIKEAIFKTIRVLQEHGADPDIIDGEGLSARAMIRRHPRWAVRRFEGIFVADEVRQQFEDVKAQDPDDIDVSGLDPNARNEDGHSHLHIASMNGNPRMIRTLIAHGCDPSATDHQGRTPLHYATLHESLDAMRELITGGTDVNIKNKQGDTPLHIALNLFIKKHSGAPVDRQIREQAAILLLKNGADPNARGNHDDTPLHLAAESMLPDAVKTLLDKGAEPLTQDNRRRKPVERINPGLHPVPFGPEFNAMKKQRLEDIEKIKQAIFGAVRARIQKKKES